MRLPQPSARTSRLARLAAAAIGALTVITCASLIGYARTGPIADDHTWNGDPAYLTSTVRGGQHRCTITPNAGEPRQITVPAMPSRGPHINGHRLDAWFTGTARITCADQVRLTHGWPVRLYPLVEQWLVLATGLILIGAGLARHRLSRRP